MTVVLERLARRDIQRSEPLCRFGRALVEWTALLGSANVQSDEQTLAGYGRTTGLSGTLPRAILRPSSTEEVQSIVRIAARENMPLYPISRGCNWGYGDACAPTPGQVIVDLGRMNRILEVNERLGYAIVEPGVTQGQLFERLRGTGLWMDATGAGEGASIVGNALDRGFGHTRYGDHWQTAAGFEVVLADGRLLRTGYGHYTNAKARWSYRYGVGPQLDGLFTQSNLGIVTRMGVWLMPEPEQTCAFLFAAPDEGALADLIDRFAPLRRQGLLQSALHIGNDLRAVAHRRRYPYERTNGATPLPADVRAALRSEHGVGAWNGAGAIYGTKGIVKETKRQIRRALGGQYPLVFLDERRLRMLSWLRRPLAWIGLGPKIDAVLDTAGPLLAVVKGEPTNGALLGASWRVQGVAASADAAPDPLTASAGLLWVSPVVPMEGAAARELVSIAEPIYAKHGFEFMVTFTLISERALACVTNISFDRRVPGEIERARACYEELWDTLNRAGYFPYRTGPRGFQRLARESEVFWDVAAQLKSALDPQGIIAPGRYEPGRAML